MMEIIEGIDCSWYEDCIYYKHCKRLKQENEALRRTIKDVNIVGVVEQSKKYKQALEEIREIAIEPSKDVNVVYNRGYHIILERILCKIKEELSD